MISDDVRGDNIVDKLAQVDEAIALNPFLEPSINSLEPIQESVIDVVIPDLEESKDEEAEVNKLEQQKKKTIRVPLDSLKNNVINNGTHDNTDSKSGSSSFFAIPKFYR
jgi:hypothetical protein